MFKDPTAEDIEKFARRLESMLGDGYSIEADKEISNLFGLVKESFDLVVYQNNNPIVAVEYKSWFYGKAFSIHTDWFHNQVRKLGVPFAIIYYNDDKAIYFYSKEKDQIQTLPLEAVVHAIINKVSWGKRPDATEFLADIGYPTFDSECEKHDICEQYRNDIDLLFVDEALEYDDSAGYFNLKQNVEDKFFKCLLRPKETKQVCRYTSLNSLFLTFRDQNHCMLSLPCMNDKGELTYSDKMVGNYIYSNSDQTVAEDNDCFILSCCSNDKIDDLTMWRLYGDNAKGCCIIYNVNENLIDNKRYFFAPVSYGDNDKLHLELEFVRAFKEHKVNGWRFCFKRWNIWKHFFKSYLFKDEDEYRLLYLATGDNKDMDWIRDNTNGIVSRIKKIEVTDMSFPLTISDVIVGPKCPEQETAVTQFKYMNLKQQIIKVKTRNQIRSSIIKDYR